MCIQDLYHEGSRVSAGLKYTMRTEAMFTERRPAHNHTAAADTAEANPNDGNGELDLAASTHSDSSEPNLC